MIPWKFDKDWPINHLEIKFKKFQKFYIFLKKGKKFGEMAKINNNFKTFSESFGPSESREG
jgi:hypothetical protein